MTDSRIRSDRQSSRRTMDRGLEHCTRGRDQTNPNKKKFKKAKGLSEEALEITEQRRKAKGKGERERYSHLNAEFQRIARREKKALLSEQCKKRKKKKEETNRRGKTRDLFKKI